MEDILNDFEEKPPKVTFIDQISFVVMFPALLMIVLIMYVAKYLKTRTNDD